MTKFLLWLDREKNQNTFDDNDDKNNYDEDDDNQYEVERGEFFSKET